VSLKSESARSLESRIEELESALAREARISNALREVGVALGTTLDLDQLLELILSKITEALEAERATLYLLDEAKDELVSRIAHGEEVRSIRLKVGHGIAGHVARTGKPLHVKDAYRDPRFNPEWDILSGYRTRSILAAPMKNHLGRTIGVVQVLNKKRGEFTEDDKVILAALATQAAVSIDNSRLFLSVIQKNMQLVDTKEQLEHRIRDLKLLFELESAMGRTASLEELFVAVLGEAIRSCEARAAAVLLRDAITGQLYLHLADEKPLPGGSAGRSSLRLRRLPMKEGEGIIGLAMLKGEIVATTTEQDELTSLREMTEIAGVDCTAALAVPLEGDDGHPMGAIALYDKRDMVGFSDEDKGLLVIIAANASTAIRLQLSREAREHEDRLTTIGRLLSGVIHDLKTPLTVISGYVQLMQSAESKEQRDEYAEHVLKQFDHISAMQREVLEFARGEKSILIRKVYLAKFFEDVKIQLEGDLRNRDIELIVDVQDRGTARFDEGKILRVVHNLARNAAEAMADRGGKFTITVRKDKTTKELIITFADNGPGIPKEIEHRLFQSFATSGKKGGTGLGLAIVKKIAEEHKGSIVLHAARGGGATFELRIPQVTSNEGVDGADR
jgi:nitrogen-specific signal transduction histidine kinase/putative methionine-R-sulfoxide reductase with GAF domain